MWLWKRESNHPPDPPLQEVPFTCEELARLQALRQRFPLYSEYLLSLEKQRLDFVRWLVEHGKLSGDT
jgi:hypothetical protein